MSSLLNFLTSKEIIVVYIVAGLACLLCLIIYIVEKNNDKIKRRHNTKELNKLVEMVKEETVKEEPEVEVVEMYDEPVLEVIEEKSDVVELLEDTGKINIEQPAVEEVEVKEEVQPVVSVIPEEVKSELIVIEKEEVEQLDVEETTTTTVESIVEKEEELEYTTIEPDQTTAKLELEKIKEELQKQEQQEVENITLTNYETEQEENAIISLEELIKKGKEMYESNEVTQYADEGNEPISLNELAGLRSNDAYEQPFVIADAVGDNIEVLEEEPQLTIAEQASIENKENVRLEDATKVVQTEVKNEVRKFKSSPIISPIYGIENNESVNELELENTANYEKLDEEIKKTNEFIMTLKELQGKLN